jgi:hypothetical protein
VRNLSYFILLFSRALTVLQLSWKVRFVKVGSDFSLVELVADIPVSIVVAGVGAGVDFGVLVLGDGVVGEAELDLGEEVLL